MSTISPGYQPSRSRPRIHTIPSSSTGTSYSTGYRVTDWHYCQSIQTLLVRRHKVAMHARAIPAGISNAMPHPRRRKSSGACGAPAASWSLGVMKLCGVLELWSSGGPWRGFLISQAKYSPTSRSITQTNPSLQTHELFWPHCTQSYNINSFMPILIRKLAILPASVPIVSGIPPGVSH